MTLNSSGPISLGGTTAGVSIEIENGGNGTTQISLNCGSVRTLAGVTTPNSAITMPTNFYGKSNRVAVTVTLSSNTANYTFNKCKISGYSAGKTCATLKINSGVYVYASGTGCKALTVPNTWTSGDVVKITNCGFIVGAGGSGGSGSGAYCPGGGGSSGGTALLVAYPVSITNNNTVGGGGGGGGGGSGGHQCISYPCCCPNCRNLVVGGGSGGTGRGLNAATPGSPGGSAGNPGGSISGGTGGSGGGWGAAGSGGGTSNASNRGGPGGSGGSGGPATSGNSLITWTVTGTRLGPLG